MPCGMCYVDVFSVADLFEPPEEGRNVKFSRKPSLLADCTTIMKKSPLSRNFVDVERKRPGRGG